ncbi:MAG: acetyl-CoA carboxylase biotin carboxylase subunit family protein [Candidatus Sericytochromatia bacterium]
MPSQAPVILCVASHLKGMHFMKEAHRLGCRVFLLTHANLLEAPWPRQALEGVYALPDFADMAAVRHAVSYLYRSVKFDKLVPMGDYDVEVTADLREHLRLPGMGVTASRYFRDKLAMRDRTQSHGIPVPAFTGLLHDADVAAFTRQVPAPWVLKPRAEAGSKGIQVLHDTDSLWRALDELGDTRSHHLLERFVEGDIFHVDSVVHEGRVVFASAQRYGRPILSLKQGGGVYSTRTIERGTREERALQDTNRRVITALGMPQGVTHIEYIHDPATGEFLFLEAAARVGAAKISDVIYYATGVCLWHEWAKLEAATPTNPYVPPVPAADHAGVVITVAHQARPDYGRYRDSEIVWRQSTRSHHAGLLVKSPDWGRVESLVLDYEGRMAAEYAAQPALAH